MSSRPPVLVIGYGNPGRGDDGAGPELVERLAHTIDGTLLAEQVETMACFQLMIEHAEYLNHRSMVVFIDASETAESTCRLTHVDPQRDRSYTSHELSPAALLEIQQRVFSQLPGKAWLLEIPACIFGLGQPMSDATRESLATSLATLNSLLVEHCARPSMHVVEVDRR